MSSSDYAFTRLHAVGSPNLTVKSPGSGRKSPSSGRKSPNSGRMSPPRSPDRSPSKLIIASRSSPMYTPDIKARFSFNSPGSPEVKSDRDSSSKVSIFDKYYSPSPDLFLAKNSPQLDSSRISDGSPEGNAKLIAGMDPELQKIYNQLRWGLYNQVHKKFSKEEYQVKSTSSRYLSLLLILRRILGKDIIKKSSKAFHTWRHAMMELRLYRKLSPKRDRSPRSVSPNRERLDQDLLKRHDKFPSRMDRDVIDIINRHVVTYSSDVVDLLDQQPSREIIRSSRSSPSASRSKDAATSSARKKNEGVVVKGVKSVAALEGRKGTAVDRKGHSDVAVRSRQHSMDAAKSPARRSSDAAASSSQPSDAKKRFEDNTPLLLRGRTGSSSVSPSPSSIVASIFKRIGSPNSSPTEMRPRSDRSKSPSVSFYGVDNSPPSTRSVSSPIKSTNSPSHSSTPLSSIMKNSNSRCEEAIIKNYKDCDSVSLLLGKPESPSADVSSSFIRYSSPVQRSSSRSTYVPADDVSISSRGSAISYAKRGPYTVKDSIPNQVQDFVQSLRSSPHPIDPLNHHHRSPPPIAKRDIILVDPDRFAVPFTARKAATPTQRRRSPQRLAATSSDDLYLHARRGSSSLDEVRAATAQMSSFSTMSVSMDRSPSKNRSRAESIAAPTTSYLVKLHEMGDKMHKVAVAKKMVNDKRAKSPTLPRSPTLACTVAASIVNTENGTSVRDAATSLKFVSQFKSYKHRVDALKSPPRPDAIRLAGMEARRRESSASTSLSDEELLSRSTNLIYPPKVQASIAKAASHEGSHVPTLVYRFTPYESKISAAVNQFVPFTQSSGLDMTKRKLQSMSSITLNTTSSAKGGPSDGGRDEVGLIAIGGGGDMYVDRDKEEALRAILFEGDSSRGHKKNTSGGSQARRSKTPDQRLRAMGGSKSGDEASIFRLDTDDLDNLFDSSSSSYALRSDQVKRSSSVDRSSQRPSRRNSLKNCFSSTLLPSSSSLLIPSSVSSNRDVHAVIEGRGGSHCDLLARGDRSNDFFFDNDSLNNEEDRDHVGAAVASKLLNCCLDTLDRHASDKSRLFFQHWKKVTHLIVLIVDKIPLSIKHMLHVQPAVLWRIFCIYCPDKKLIPYSAPNTKVNMSSSKGKAAKKASEPSDNDSCSVEPDSPAAVMTMGLSIPKTPPAGSPRGRTHPSSSFSTSTPLYGIYSLKEADLEDDALSPDAAGSSSSSSSPPHEKAAEVVMMAASAKEWKKLLDVEGLWQLLKDFNICPHLYRCSNSMFYCMYVFMF